MAVDQDKENYGKFILTGSSQLHFIHHIYESLAGRIGLLTLLPYQCNELPLKFKG
jgi:predicted AAA+ superfamily ATPase